MRRCLLAVAAALVLGVAGPVSVVRAVTVTTEQAPPQPGAEVRAFVTGFSWYDNTPPGSADIAYSSAWDPRTVHTQAGGTGTYADPLTVAVGHVKDPAGRSTPDWAPGTRFYLPYLHRYLLVEDLCGDGPTPQNGPCHTGYPAEASTWLDLWVGGRTSTPARSQACMNAITGVHTAIKDPPPSYPVDPGDIATSTGCAQQHDDTPPGAAASVSQLAFQANTSSLWTTGALGTEDKRLGMMPGTSPSITAVNGGYQVAFQANSGRLWTTGALGTQDFGLGMMPGTSPSITAVNGGAGYQVAFQANSGNLWSIGSLGSRDLGLGMRKDTSPSIAPVGGGYQVAFQANTTSLWTTGTQGTEDRRLGMSTGTSPSIAPVGGGYQVAFQANTTSLWTTGTQGTDDKHLGMMARTSPDS